jgi:hypothetical protein
MNKLIAFFGMAFIAMDSNAQLNPFTIGTVNPGDSIVIYYDVTINTPCGCTQISNQGTVSGSNFATFNTNDPDTGPAGDPTITLLNMFALPVRLLEFKAQAGINVINVSWNVSSEDRLSHYVIERSTDGRTFNSIGNRTALNSTSPLTYTFTDLTPNNGVNYYRLKMVDQDGAFKFSAIVRVDMNDKNRSVTVFPNPVTGKTISIQFNNLPKDQYEISVYIITGQIVYQHSLFHPGGSLSKTLMLPANLVQGIYHIQIRSGQDNFSQMLILQ